MEGIEVYVTPALRDREDKAVIKLEGLLFKRFYVSGVKTDFMRG